MAYLYSEGGKSEIKLSNYILFSLPLSLSLSLSVPDGPGKGTLKAINGQKAAEYLKKAETLICHKQPFSWVLIRPPFATTCICCKACVCQEMKQHCTTTNDKVCLICSDRTGQVTIL